LDDFEDNPCMGGFWGSGEGVAENRDGVIVGEGIRFDEVGSWDIVKEELGNEVRVVSWLNGK
jgi:hypothetical protein